MCMEKSVDNMKTISSVLFVCVLTGSFAVPPSSETAKKSLLEKERVLLELLQYPHQPGESIYEPEYLKIVNSFDMKSHINEYNDFGAVTEFMRLSNKGLIPYDESFSIYIENHRQEATALSNVLYSSKKWDIFYKTVIWARFNVNPGAFVYALHVAVAYRNDFADMEIPIIYEIFPNLFFNFGVTQSVLLLKKQGFQDVEEVDGVYNLIVYANYSGNDVYSVEDQKLAYFIEDIGLNAMNFYFEIENPFWLSGKEYGLYKDRGGEHYMFFHSQLLARFYLERLSNDYGDITELTWSTPIVRYSSNLRTYYGAPFVSREEGYIVNQDISIRADIDTVNDIEKRLLSAIDSDQMSCNGTFFNISSPGAIEYLGNILQGNPDCLDVTSPNYLSHIYKVIGKYSSVLYHPEAKLRDPIYWMVMKRVQMFYEKFMDRLRPYTAKEIGFDGVRINSVNVGKLTTFFDYFDADITNAVPFERPVGKKTSPLSRFGRVSQYNGDDYVIEARLWRLNHVPFKVSINVASQVATKSVVRIFLGPKTDENGRTLELNENRFKFVLLDAFEYDLIAGTNKITRESCDFFMQVPDRTTYYELYKWLMLASEGKKTWTMPNTETRSGFPNRLLLPKGKEDGLTYSLFIHISPYHAPTRPQDGSRIVDASPFNYPLDRRIGDVWHLDNMYYYDATIYHTTESEINRAQVLKMPYELSHTWLPSI